MYYVVGALRRCGVRGGGVRKTFTLAAASGSGSLVSVSVCVGCRALSTEVQVSTPPQLYMICGKLRFESALNRQASLRRAVALNRLAV